MTRALDYIRSHIKEMARFLINMVFLHGEAEVNADLAAYLGDTLKEALLAALEDTRSPRRSQWENE